MPNIFAIIASLLLGVQSLFNPSLPTKSNSINNSEPIKLCLNEQLAKKGIDPGFVKVPKILKDIKKATKGNTTSGYEIPECRSIGACDGPETADYRLIATNIKLDHTVFPNSFIEGEKLSDRQLVKQVDISDNPILADKYKNRVYRSFCGDWCYTCKPADVKCLDDKCLRVECDTHNPPAVLQFRGSYYCNFIFYLQNSDNEGNPQLDDLGNPISGALSDKDPNIPKDNSVYSVYFREGAALPSEISCENSINTGNVNLTPEAKLIGTLIEYPKKSEKHWRLVKNPNNADGSFTARNSEITDYQIIDKLVNPAGLTGTYDLVQNLVDPENQDLLYLTAQNTVLEMIDDLSSKPPIIKLFSYYLLERWDKLAEQKSLKLGTFPFKMDWVKDWVKESKPAIYIYPEKETAVNIKLKPLGYLTVSNPPYDPINGWNIVSYPDGLLQPVSPQLKESPSYPYLYYEAALSEKPNPKAGFVITKDKLAGFFDDSLATLGLNERELSDFKEYWLPRLNIDSVNYYLIYFLNQKEIERIEPISISIPIDTSIRIRLYFKPLKEIITLPEQNLSPAPKRYGNIMVEWGGILDE